MNILSVWDQTAILDLLTEGKRASTANIRAKLTTREELLVKLLLSCKFRTEIAKDLEISPASVSMLLQKSVYLWLQFSLRPRLLDLEVPFNTDECGMIRFRSPTDVAILLCRSNFFHQPPIR